MNLISKKGNLVFKMFMGSMTVNPLETSVSPPPHPPIPPIFTYFHRACVLLNNIFFGVSYNLHITYYCNNIVSFVCVFQKKNNGNQVIWLMQKGKRETASTSGFKTFQEFLDNQQYSSTGILRYEKIFGKTFISTGGLDTTKVRMLQLLNSVHGKFTLASECAISCPR